MSEKALVMSAKETKKELVNYAIKGAAFDPRHKKPIYCYVHKDEGTPLLVFHDGRGVLFQWAELVSLSYLLLTREENENKQITFIK